MRFEQGGRWRYAMVGPQGEKHWSIADYQQIRPLNSFSALNGFSDENGTLLKDMPRSTWKNHFRETGAHTTVDISISFETLEDLEKIMETGFKEGFTMAMDNLDAVLKMLQ